MINLNIGGVPEHFNLPWHQVLDSPELQVLNVQASWKDFPAGTGAMVKALNEGNIDIAMLVTEGAVAAHHQAGCGFDIVSFYTTSPLLWGIHVSAESDITTPTDLAGKRYAISRYGSGSHIMAKVHARSMGWSVEDLTFVLIENLDGARQAFRQQRADIFFWEHFTTKPYVDNGEFRWLGDFPPPWPGFSVCVRHDVMLNHSALITLLLNRVYDQAKILKHGDHSHQLIAEQYQLVSSDVQQWLAHTTWAEHCHIDTDVLERVKQAIM